MKNIGRSFGRTVIQVVMHGVDTNSFSNCVGKFVWHSFDVILEVIRLAKL
jgi:hypothetical protein